MFSKVNHKTIQIYWLIYRNRLLEFTVIAVERFCFGFVVVLVSLSEFGIEDGRPALTDSRCAGRFGPGEHQRV